MNQILNTNSNSSEKNSKYIKLKNFIFFKLFFIVSLILFLLSILLLFSANYSKTKEESLSTQIIEKYNISKLYSTKETDSYNYISFNGNDILGFIEIPKLNIYYPVFANINDDLLKIAPCKFAGSLPNEKGNLCIAGHNYDNNKFFSKISTLKNEDEIYIYDTSNNKTIYHVFANYEVTSNDLSPISSSNANTKEITLITCNNFNNNRIIIKAKE